MNEEEKQNMNLNFLSSIRSGNVTEIVITILIASVIGCIAGIIAGNRGEGLITNAFYGVVGSLLASWLFPAFGIVISGWYGFYIEAIIGAVIAILLSKAVFAVAAVGAIIMFLMRWPF